MSKNLYPSIIFTSLCLASVAMSQTPSPPTRDVFADTWVCTDALGRVMPTNAEAGDAKPDKFAGIFYFLWLGHHGPDKVYDISEMLKANPDDPQFGPEGAFHWWGKPRFGYYRSDDEWVIRRHVQMLADAGIDVLICDVTNAFTYEKEVTALIKVIREIRSRGERAPGIAFITNSKHAATLTTLYDKWYKPGTYDDVWFKWQGKPLVMSNKEAVAREQLDYFTFRHSWAFTDKHARETWMGDGREKWPWIANYPQGYGWRDDEKKPEEVSVAIATHPIAGIGRSNLGKEQPPEGRNNPELGTYFAAQWERALELDPEFVFITGWNEWVAQRFFWGKPAKVGFVGYKKPGEGDSYFVDQFNEEFSRDAEPMAGGYGDNYWLQLAYNVRKFKGVRPLPAASGATSIDIGGAFNQWANVGPEYRDHLGETIARNHPGFGDAGQLVNKTGRNDIALAKVSADADNVYFYVETAAALSAPAGPTWMTLLIDTDGGRDTGWEGYDLIINRTPPAKGVATVEEQTGAGWTFRKLGQAKIRYEGNRLHIAVPKSLIGDRPFIDFKWVDHVPEPGNIADFLDQGDVAPSGRFNYRYTFTK